MQRARNSSWRAWLLAAGGLVVIVGTLLALRIPQDERYHLFADTGTIGGIPNLWNVASPAE